MSEFRQTITHDRLRRLYDYWSEKRGLRTMPARADIDPLEIPDLLANLILLDVESAPPRFRVRLYGTNVVEIRGRDMTGEYLAAPTFSNIAGETIPLNEQTVRTRQPVYTVGSYPQEGGGTGTFYRLGLPLSRSDADIDMILIGFYVDGVARIAAPWGDLPRLRPGGGD